MSTRKDNRRFRIGEVRFMTFYGIESEQQGLRPALVFQNNVGNDNSPNTIVLPMTSAQKKLGQPTHVFVPKSVGLKADSIVLCENPQCVSKSRLGACITTLPDLYMAKVAEASLLATSALSFLSPDRLHAIRERSAALNGARVQS